MAEIKTLGPVGFNPTGEYDITHKYERLDVVYYEGSSYVSLKESIGQLPTNNEYWDCLGISGADISNYYTKAETNSLLETKQHLINNENKLSASLVSGLSTVATSGSYNDLSNKPSIPSNTSDLTNDSGFITNSVNNLTNYYTKTYIDNLVGDVETILTTLDIGGGI